MEVEKTIMHTFEYTRTFNSGNISLKDKSNNELTDFKVLNLIDRQFRFIKGIRYGKLYQNNLNKKFIWVRSDL